MVESTTQNYGWTKPEVTKSASTWGGFLNGDLDAIDALVFANQQGIVPIGAIQMFGGAAAPANWVLCDGTSYVRVAPYDKLFAVFGTKFGSVDASHFNVPDLRDFFPIGASATRALAAKGGLATVTLDATMIPAHAHPITDQTHTHTVTPVAHSHTNAAHGHTASQTPHDHGLTTQVLKPLAGVNVALGSGWQFPVDGTPRTDTQQPTVTVNPQSITIDPQNATVTIAPQATGITGTGNTGGGVAHNNMPPWLGLNFIVRFQ